jgi:hypothetical protein
MTVSESLHAFSFHSQTPSHAKLGLSEEEKIAFDASPEAFRNAYSKSVYK